MKTFELIPLPTPKKGQANDQSSTASKAEPSKATTLRLFVDVSIEMADKLKDYAYWERLTTKETMFEALRQFLEGKTIKSRPEAVKNRKNAGRKRKE
jgi:hypothetical protein